MAYPEVFLLVEWNLDFHNPAHDRLDIGRRLDQPEAVRLRVTNAVRHDPYLTLDGLCCQA